MADTAFTDFNRCARNAGLGTYVYRNLYAALWCIKQGAPLHVVNFALNCQRSTIVENLRPAGRLVVNRHDYGFVYSPQIELPRLGMIKGNLYTGKVE